MTRAVLDLEEPPLSVSSQGASKAQAWISKGLKNAKNICACVLCKIIFHNFAWNKLFLLSIIAYFPDRFIEGNKLSKRTWGAIEGKMTLYCFAELS